MSVLRKQRASNERFASDYHLGALLYPLVEGVCPCTRGLLFLKHDATREKHFYLSASK
jgi:hypothetical protein